MNEKTNGRRRVELKEVRGKGYRYYLIEYRAGLLYLKIERTTDSDKAIEIYYSMVRERLMLQ